jgi:MFS family permease
VLQLLVYAGLQVPVGVLLDRFGPRRLVVTGAVVMSAGQAVLATATVLPVAVAGRCLVGAGDALTFICVLRLVAAWFPARRVPVVTQMTGLLGQSGQLLSAVPLVALLAGPGWAPAFGSAAALGVVVAVLAAAVLRDSPAGSTARPVPGARRLVLDLRIAWRHPGTRLGLWTHFVTQFPGTVFALMWGFPYLVQAEGVPVRTASALLALFVLTGVAAGPVAGVLVQRHPLRRSWLVLAVVGANVGGWTLVLLWPGQAPTALLALLVVAMASGGPGSMIGFDFARTFNPPNRLGTATGIVNVGGFTASLVTILLVGVVLDLLGGASASRGEFRAAMAVQYPVWAVGVAGVLVTRRQARQVLARRGVVVPPLREALGRRRAERRRRRGS